MPGFCAIAILAFSLLLTQASFGGDAGVRSRESFNAGWRFGRFGPMPDGSTTPEPGAERWSVTARASSEESSKGNGAEDAFDGDPQTRWCASGGAANEWVQLDLGADRQIGRVALDWEFPELTYGSAIETSADGKQWTPFAPGPVRFFRVRVTKLPEGKWASIREIRLFDAEGQPIRNTRVAGGEAPSSTTFDDSGWRMLDVPHDWGIEGPFRDDLPGDTGKLPWKGIGWYRKHFNVPAGDQGKRIFIDFDGAMANARVWLNGHEVGGWPYGYQPFRLELTPHVKFGSDNVLAVRLDTAHWGSRWYPGAGLYRNVWLVKTNPVHVAHWGVLRDDGVDDGREGNRPGCRHGREPGQGDASVHSPIGHPRIRGRRSAGARVAATRPPHRSGQAPPARSIGLAVVPKPRRWDLAAPNLYLANDGPSRRPDRRRLRPALRLPDDRVHASRRVQAQRPPRPAVRHVQPPRPRPAGGRAERPSPRAAARDPQGDGRQRAADLAQPARAELLDLADRMGFVVMVEAFDCWKRGKTCRRLQQALRRVAREGPAGHGPPRAEPSQRGHVEHRQRDRRAERAGAGPAAPRHRPRRGSDPARHGGLQQRQCGHERVPDRGGRLRAQLQPVGVSADPEPSRQRAETDLHVRVFVVRQLAGRVLLPVKRGRDSRGQLPGLVVRRGRRRPGPSRRTRSSRPSTRTPRSSASSSGPASTTWASRRRTIPT